MARYTRTAASIAEGHHAALDRAAGPGHQLYSRLLLKVSRCAGKVQPAFARASAARTLSTKEPRA